MPVWENLKSTSPPNGCTYDFNAGTEVTLTTTANTDSVFAGWSDGTGSASGCTGKQSCTFTVTDDSSVTATFTKPTLSGEEGTIGTQLTITGPGFGDKKGKVLIGGIAAKIAKEEWTDDVITCTLNKVPPEGTHDVTIKPYKVDEILLPGAFTVEPPEITSLDTYQGAAGTPITISGNFFSTKKGKVYFEYEINGKLKKKKCKITDWGMDSITFEVPKTSKSFPAGDYQIKVMNKVGYADAPSAFTVN